LTWRSIVNRVWRYHIGRGIESPNDFGKMGQPPTHPELLDWLAFSFARRMARSRNSTTNRHIRNYRQFQSE
jgi:hypothetical protein